MGCGGKERGVVGVGVGVGGICGCGCGILWVWPYQRLAWAYHIISVGFSCQNLNKLVSAFNLFVLWY